MTRAIVTLAALSVLSAAACSSTEGDPDDAMSSEAVTMARCPASLTLKLTSLSVLRATPTKYYDGRPLTAQEQSLTKAAMTSARSLGDVTLNVGDVVRSGGTCTYKGEDDARVVLRTKNGKDRADIFYKNYRVYAPLGSYSRDGITITSRMPVSFFANVAASNPTPNQPSLNVRIGQTTVTSISALPQPGADTGLRVPVRDENEAFLNAADPTFPKTIQLSWGGGVAAHSALRDRAEGAGHTLMGAGSIDNYETADPATSICFTGRAEDVCDMLPTFADGLLSEMFVIADDDDGNPDCQASANRVSLRYYYDEGDSEGESEIPRCR